jgi:hypothetical protein
MPARGCGHRVAGGLYLVWLPPYNEATQQALIPPDADYRPRWFADEFILDPPHPVDVEALGVTPIGMTPVLRNGVWHLLDWVGEEHYPNVADFVEEARRQGVSRRISMSVLENEYTEASRLLLIHRKAYIANWMAYRSIAYHGGRRLENIQRNWRCPAHLAGHEEGRCNCAGIWWEDVAGAAIAGDNHPSEWTRVPSARWTIRDLASGEFYRCAERPPGVVPEYQPAIFASFPFTRYEIVRDRIAGRHQRIADQLEARNETRYAIVDE